ncbi:hypothetical protein TNCV_2646121 [Trichonephila clavipes]|nr:hypothetical protein TNCV_2646121 [Trichonephila clavipes]
MLVHVYEALSMKCGYVWFTCSREGRQSVSDNSCSERPANSVSDKNIEKVSQLTTKDCRLIVRKIAGQEMLQGALKF